MKTFNNLIRKYDEMIYNSRPVKFDEYISNKYDKIHVELFNDALKKYYNQIINSLISKKFIYNFFKLLENSYSNKFTGYDDEEYYKSFYDKLLCDRDNYINKVIKELSIDKEVYVKEVFNIINNYISNIKKIVKEYKVLVNSSNTPLDTSINDFRISYYDRNIFLENENAEFSSINNYISYTLQFENGEIINEDFLLTEEDEYTFIFEKDEGSYIGYNPQGEFLLILDSLFFNDYPKNNFNFFNYINKVNNNLLEKIREYALYLYKLDHKIIEFKNSEYWMPSSILIISKIFPYSKKIVKLHKYWNNIQSLNDLNISDIKLTNYPINDAELLELNYVKGIAKMRSKLDDMEFEVPFGYLNENVSVSDDLKIELIK